MSRPWSHEEDDCLRDAVQRYGAVDAWKQVASLVPGRDNKACRKRWLHSLDPTLKKTAWEPEEDQKLVNLYLEMGPKWSRIAREIPGRTDDACSKRYREALNPDLRKDSWTPEEVALLQELCIELGNKWVEIGRRIGRSGLDCRNKMRTLDSKLKGNSHSSPRQALDSRDQLIEESPLITSTLATFPDQMPVMANSISLADDNFYPPYYPMETYPPVLHESSPSLQLFLEPGPPITPVSPEAAPFQPSSSSLHLALSEPLRSRPLPSDNFESMPQYDLFNPAPPGFSHSQPQSHSGSPLCFPEFIGVDDVAMSQIEDFGASSYSQPQPSSLLLQGLGFNGPLRTLPFPVIVTQPENVTFDNNFMQAMSPISPTSLGLPGADSMWNLGQKSPGLPASFSPFDQSPGLVPQTGMTFASEISDDVSSIVSTPATTSVPASVISSPFSASSVDLAAGPLSLPGPSDKPVTYDSLLFSVNPDDSSLPKLRRRPSKQPGEPPRLSSTLNFSINPSIQPYTCAHASCVSPGDPNGSKACFANSKGLGLHVKEAHPNWEEEFKATKEGIFKCGLDGCGRKYSALNGLQYHLQLAPVHFEVAISQQQPIPVVEEPEISKKRSPPNKRYHQNAQGRFVCALPNCYKTYSQKSGVRYHLESHHKRCNAAMQPEQVLEVPPMLKQRLSRKATTASSYPS